jgi:hypothetical protein
VHKITEDQMVQLLIAWLQKTKSSPRTVSRLIFEATAVHEPSNEHKGGCTVKVREESNHGWGMVVEEEPPF